MPVGIDVLRALHRIPPRYLADDRPQTACDVRVLLEEPVVDEVLVDRSQLVLQLALQPADHLGWPFT
jgi:hypothetical protein